MVYLATQLCEDSYKKMRYYFKEIDVNKDGTIQFHELRNFMMSYNDMKDDVDPKAYKLIFDILDQNKTGNIEYREFVAATIRKTLFKDLILDEENLEIIDIK